MVSLVAGSGRDATRALDLIDGESCRFGGGFCLLHMPPHCPPMTLLIDFVGPAYVRYLTFLAMLFGFS